MKKHLFTAILILLIFIPWSASGQDDGLGGLTKFATTDQTIEEIMKIILENNYDFKVKQNWVFDMPSEEKKTFLSLGIGDIKSLKQAAGPMSEPPVFKNGSLPGKYDLRNRDGHTYIGPIRNQGSCGSCYSFAMAAVAESTYNLALDQTDSRSADFSEAFVAFCLSRHEKYRNFIKGCNGASIQCMAAPTDIGMGTEKDFPYTPVDPGRCPNMNMPTVKFKSYGYIEKDDIDAVKSAIYAHGAVWASVASIPAFQAYSEGTYEDTNTDCSDLKINHAVSLVGWNDNGDPDKQGYWILRNSWGPDWGENGYMRIKYRAAQVLCGGIVNLVYGDGGQPNPDGGTPDENKPDKSRPDDDPSIPSSEKVLDVLLN